MLEAVQLEIEAGQRQNLRRNYLAHSFEGGLFFGALSFVSATTLLPTMVRDLGGPNWLVSMMPVMMGVGVLLPPIFTAHLIDRLGRYMPLLLVTGIFQRLPYLLAGLALLFGAGHSPVLALAAVAMAPLLSGVVCGVGFTAWQQLLIRTIPDRRRSSLFAARSLIYCVIGLGAGWMVRTVLGRWPGTTGYGLLHLLAFGFLAVSYVVFATIREAVPPSEQPNEQVGFVANIRAIPSMVLGDRRLCLFLLASATMSGIYILAPFLAIHARGVLGRPESYLGDLLIVQTAGTILGTVVSGYLGDRFGGKLVVLLSASAFLALAAWSMVAASDAAFRAIFFIFGFGYISQMIGGKTLSLEVCRSRHRSTCLATMALVKLVSMLAATGVSGLIWNGTGCFAYVAAATLGCVVVAVAVLMALPEPRKGAAGEQWATSKSGRWGLEEDGEGEG